ncbi:hypothetical protein VPH35_018811 [Triticum aestivum]|uniref:putative F-box/FBD/LRR-repeat protein At3g49030 isoform X2 n=1 Tax=Triticum aestivum TaxID=4565 RepID=UPI001D035886|nr:putative F-box/FBD/LRR-repeat protein At3g49030 isoform X2 [Triticum aestivum]
MERAPEHRPQKLSVAAGVGGGGGEDRLSALPDDVLVHILLKLCDTALAARTSVLARRWRRVWALLPELHFPVGTGPDRIRAALTAHDAPAFRHLFVAAIEVTPESAASWLPIAARRLSGVLHFKNRGDMNEASAGERGALQLPCFEKATKVVLDLRSIGLTLPPSGEFTRLTDLELVHIQLHGPCSLSDVVSSPRCPSLFSARNRHSLMLPHHFHHISKLILILLYLPVCGDKRFLMEEMTKLPNITTLGLVVLACGHSFGAGSFHVLKMSSGIRELTLQLVTRSDCKVAFVLSHQTGKPRTSCYLASKN